MKVEAFDWKGDSVGVAYHEDDHGTVYIEATRQCVAVAFKWNDGDMMGLSRTVPLYPGDLLRIRVKREEDRMDSYRRHLDELLGESKVDKTATRLSWWRRISNWWRSFTWTS